MRTRFMWERSWVVIYRSSREPVPLQVLTHKKQLSITIKMIALSQRKLEYANRLQEKVLKNQAEIRRKEKTLLKTCLPDKEII